MEDKSLIPAHFFYAKWFIRIRWLSIAILLTSIFAVSHWTEITIMTLPLYFLTGILFFLNLIHYFIFRQIRRATHDHVIKSVKKEIHFQISTDFIILTLVLHYSGGVENPLIMLYFLHMIIASSIFKRLGSYLQTGFAITILILMATFEHLGVVNHYHLDGMAIDSLYHNGLYLFGYGMIFIFVSALVVGLTHLLKYKSIAAEENYVRTNLQLKKKDKVQNQYVLRVTHDIKGHLAAIISRLSVVRAEIIGPLNNKQTEFIDRAYTRTEQLSDFVQDILSLSRKRLMMVSENEQFSLNETIGKVVSRIQTLSNDKSIKFIVSIDNSIDEVIGNPTTIEELYSNLLRNSIIYTPEGGQIRLSVKKVSNDIVTEITDSGIGIPKDEIHKVFNEFYRGSNAKKSGNSGSGLGLSIAKQIVENHRGKIRVDSEQGIWTKFTFSIPKIPIISANEVSVITGNSKKI